MTPFFSTIIRNSFELQKSLSVSVQASGGSGGSILTTSPQFQSIFCVICRNFGGAKPPHWKYCRGYSPLRPPRSATKSNRKQKIVSKRTTKYIYKKLITFIFLLTSLYVSNIRHTTLRLKEELHSKKKLYSYETSYFN